MILKMSGCGRGFGKPAYEMPFGVHVQAEGSLRVKPEVPYRDGTVPFKSVKVIKIVKIIRIIKNIKTVVV